MSTWSDPDTGFGQMTWTRELFARFQARVTCPFDLFGEEQPAEDYTWSVQDGSKALVYVRGHAESRDEAQEQADAAAAELFPDLPPEWTPLAEYRLGDENEGAVTVAPHLWETAEALLRLLSVTGVGEPSVIPDGQGGLYLSWDRGDDGVLEVELTSQNQITVAREGVYADFASTSDLDLRDVSELLVERFL